jgi:chromodomain-helicase-DNA-binding protein 1
MKIKESGERVIMFSQSLKILDLFEDYLSLKLMKFQRVDGNLNKETRLVSYSLCLIRQ